MLATPCLGGHYLTEVGPGYSVNKITRGDPYDSKIALLAADNVCLNPTRLFSDLRKPDGTPLTPEYPWGETTGYYTASASNSALVFSVTTAGRPHPRMNLLLRQAANADSTVAVMQLSLKQQYDDTRYRYLWYTDPGNPLEKASAINLYLGNSATIFSVFPWTATAVGAPPHDEWPNFLYGGPQRKVLDDPYGIQCWNLNDLSRYTAMNTEVLDINSFDQVFRGYGTSLGLRLDWQDLPWTDQDGAGYQLYAGTRDDPRPGVLVTCLDLQVDALIYAQRGSWYIIPGHYWYDEANDHPARRLLALPGRTGAV